MRAQGIESFLFIHMSQVTDTSYVLSPEAPVRVPALFINFNAVECPLPDIHSYLIYVSNNGIDNSDPLLYIPFDSVCHMCSTNDTRCTKRVGLFSAPSAFSCAPPLPIIHLPVSRAPFNFLLGKQLHYRREVL